MTSSVLTPQATGRAVKARKGGLEFWKQIIPADRDVQYHAGGETRTLNFASADYHADILEAFRTKSAIDQVAFQLADKSNGHGRDLSPEQQRGEVIDMTTLEGLPPKVRAKLAANGEDNPGTYARIRMFNDDAARLVRENPKLGVSARIREGFTNSDGVTTKRAAIHILGTIDPRVMKMGPWTEADLAGYPDQDDATLDLSNTYYSGDPVGKQNTKDTSKQGEQSTIPDDLESLSDADLAALAREFGLNLDDVNLDDLDDVTGDGADDLGEEPDGDPTGGVPPVKVPAGAGAGANADLSNRVDLATEAANEALAQLAEGQWLTEKSRLLDLGVPAAMLGDDVKAILTHPGGFTVDLSNSPGDMAEVDAAAVVRKLLGGMAGYVDLANETGHGGQFTTTTDADPDQATLDRWNAQFPG